MTGNAKACFKEVPGTVNAIRKVDNKHRKVKEKCFEIQYISVSDNFGCKSFLKY